MNDSPEERRVGLGAGLVMHAVRIEIVAFLVHELSGTYVVVGRFTDWVSN